MDEKIEAVAHILKSSGIRMEISGCGCCGSPHVKFEYHGNIVLQEDYVFLDMFEEKVQ